MRLLSWACYWLVLSSRGWNREWRRKAGLRTITKPAATAPGGAE